jgi:phi13 family phage major tail protein
MANSGEFKSSIGLDSLYVATVTADSTSAYTSGTPATLAPAAKASMKPSSSMETQYADDQAYDVMTSEGPTEIEVEVTGIDMAMLAAITGRVFDVASGRLWDNAANPPYYALGFRSLKSNGSYRYYWFPKGVFSMPEEEVETKGEKPKPATLKLKYTAIKTIYKWSLGSVTDGVKRVTGDTDATNFVATTWFSQVQVPGVVAPSALALSSSTPTDGATGISVSANQTLTFNNALSADAVYNVVIAKASDGVVPANSTTIDTARKVITIDPNSSLTGATPYIIAYAVTDIFGQHLAGIVNFTTT